MSDERVQKPTRERIVEVATRLFATVGYESSSIEVILDEAQVSRGALYHHFASKDVLFEAVFVALEAEVAAATVRQARRSADPAQRLRDGCRSFVEHAGRPDVRRIVLIDAPAVLGWTKWREIEERYGLGLMKQGVQAAIVASGRPVKNVDERAHLLLAATIEAALVIARADDPRAASRACLDVLDRIVDGIVR